MDNDIRSATLLMIAYIAGISLSFLADKPEMAFGLMCSFITLLAVVAFSSDENQRLRRRLKKYKRAVEKIIEAEHSETRAHQSCTKDTA